MTAPAADPETLLWLLEIVATLAFGLSGFIEATRKRMDIVGICAVAFIAAFGGGTLRDILLDRRPFFWAADGWVLGVLGTCVLGLWLMRSRHLEFTERAIRVPDALGLGLFTVTGTGLALGMELPPTVAVLMGVVTAVFGGVLRDVVCNEIPAVFRDHRPYAVCSFAGAWCYVGLEALRAPPWAAALAGAALAAGLRLLALARGWQVPGWREGR